MNKNGVSIVATIGIMLILSVLAMAGVSLLGSASGLGMDYMQAQQAFYIAEAGKEWYLEQLQDDSDWSNNTNELPKAFGGGSFTITVSNASQNAINVISNGSLTGYESQPVQRVIEAGITRQALAEGYNYAIYAGGKIDTNNTENLNINGNTKENQTDFPSVDYSYYQSIASHVISGNYTFTAGTYSGIWYVDGNVSIDSAVTLNGTIVTTGNINMTGSDNIVVTATPPYPALVAEGNFLFQNASNITVAGLIYVGANMSGNFLSQRAENINFTGTILIKGNFNLQGSKDVTITYDPSILGNPPPGFSGGGGTGAVMTSAGWHEVLN